MRRLAGRFRLAVLSGDTERERAAVAQWFGEGAELRFRQSPADKLAYVRELQAAGRSVMMVGDGLNDAGALKQSDAGVAVCDDASAFSPACDAIAEAANLDQLAATLQYARRVMAVVSACFALSFVYNIVGISIAARALLSPLISAVLMPLSSVSVVALATGAATWLAPRRREAA